MQPAFTDLTTDSPFPKLVDYWLEDLELEGHLARSTRDTYEWYMRKSSCRRSRT